MLSLVYCQLYSKKLSFLGMFRKQGRSKELGELKGDAMSMAGGILENPKAFDKKTRSKKVARENIGLPKDKEKLCIEPEKVDEVLNKYLA